MTQLKQGIADKEQTKADGNFVNADPDKQNAYNQAVAKAEALVLRLMLSLHLAKLLQR